MIAETKKEANHITIHEAQNLSRPELPLKLKMGVAPPKTNMTMDNLPFEDVFTCYTPEN